MPRIVPVYCHVCQNLLVGGACPKGCSSDPEWLGKQRMTCVCCKQATNDKGECENCGYED